MTDIVDRLTEATGFALMDAARQTLRDAVAEIRRLRGELVLWKAAATLTRDERHVLEQAIASATLVGTEDQVRRLRWLLERLTFPVPEPMPKEKLAEVSDGSYQKTDENRGNCDTCRAEVDRLREAIRRLADQDATLSVQDGNVTVTMDATLTPEEHDAVETAALEADAHQHTQRADTLRGLLERLA